MNLLLSRLVLHFKVKCTCSKTTGVNTNKKTMHDLEKSVTPPESNTVFKPHYLQSDLDPFHLI